ncbi:MAG: 5'-nucleotidase C-terminal domain-containing protein [Eubacteriales bacterium]|nr:5'-nucleotidase C-terminal domain-containing protein [Eubacteriales bacterium]
MKKISKRLCSLVLVMMMVFSYVPAVAAADLDDTANVESTESLDAENTEAVESEADTEEPQADAPDTDSDLEEPAAQADPAEGTEDYEGWDTIKVFETTDIHGWITDVSTYKEETFQYRLAYIAKIVNDARANTEAYDDVLLLDTGDIYQGTPHSNLTYGAALLAAFDAMEYDAVGLGNHEFDWDVTTYAADSDGTMAPYEIGDYKGDSDIPVLMSNLYYAGTKNRVDFTQDYTVVEKAGHRVAIIGWADDYRADIKASQIAPYEIDDDMNKLNTLASEVKEKEEADIVIVLAHADPAPIADALDPNVVDLVAGGHTHQRTNGTSEVTGIDYMQGYRYAYGYSTTEIKISPEGEVDVVTPTYVDTAYNYDLVPNLYYKDGNNTALDPEIVKISQAAWDAVKGEMYEVLCTVDQSITRSYIDPANGTTSIAGSWIAELMLAATKEYNTVAAFANRGGVRADLVMEPGAATRDITVADIYTISPFGNRTLTFAITGQQMAQQLENALIGLNPEIGIEGGYSNSNYGDQFAGITMTYRVVDGGIKVVSIITDDGEIIDVNDNTKTYNVCTNEYCATLPGSVFENMTPLVKLDDAPIDNLSTIEALRERRDTVGLAMELDTSVHSMTIENKIQQITDAVDEYDAANVTSADKAALEGLLTEIDALFASDSLSEAEAAALQSAKADIAEMLAKIAEADNKGDGEEGNGSDNVKPADKTDNKTAGKGGKAARTGDTNEVMPWAVMLMIGAVGIAGVAETSRRKQKRG